MRDAVRYLETGEIGRLAYKPKDKDSHDEDELEDDKDNVSLLMIELLMSIYLFHQAIKQDHPYLEFLLSVCVSVSCYKLLNSVPHVLYLLF